MPAPETPGSSPDEKLETLRKLLRENAARLRLLSDPEYIAQALVEHPQLRGQLDDPKFLARNKEVIEAMETLAKHLDANRKGEA